MTEIIKIIVGKENLKVKYLTEENAIKYISDDKKKESKRYHA